MGRKDKEEKPLKIREINDLYVRIGQITRAQMIPPIVAEGNNSALR